MRRLLGQVIAASSPARTPLMLPAGARRSLVLRKATAAAGASATCPPRSAAGLTTSSLARRRLHDVSGHRRFSDFVVPGYEPDDTSGLRLSFVASCSPHPNKVLRGGEDGYFACPDSRSFGVADGVGGWAEVGADPGEFARRLLEFAYQDLRHRSVGHLPEAFAAAASRINIEKIKGGSTLLLGQLDGTTLAVLNLGDSGTMVLRPATRTSPGSGTPLLFPRIIFRSSDQTHYFNCPYQLSSGQGHIEEPDLIHVQVREGDVVIAATDGVFDNLFDRQLQGLVARHLGSAWRSGEDVEPHLQSLATDIVEHAQKIGKQEELKDIITPFALSAHSEGLSYRGGKLDDTTAVVALVRRCHGEPAAELPPDVNFLPTLHNWNVT